MLRDGAGVSGRRIHGTTGRLAENSITAWNGSMLEDDARRTQIGKGQQPEETAPPMGDMDARTGRSSGLIIACPTLLVDSRAASVWAQEPPAADWLALTAAGHNKRKSRFSSLAAVHSSLARVPPALLLGLDTSDPGLTMTY